MAVFKCKMCGGELNVTEGASVAECEYCGTQQTLPKANDEVIQNLFNRANNLRLKCEFDKAEQVYEKILQKNEEDAEAHWGIVLCKYGIEYVEDPKTFKRIPTCHRTSYDAVTTDADYLSAIEYADALQKSIYEAEAKAIDEIQKNILRIVKNEKPFDVFICYKETDENGKRTVDSVIANDIYHQLTQEGLKVFYAAITLEDKLGQAYEPYIFAALNSARVMLVIGTQPQYFTAVWVKNEWSRFLKLMKTDRKKLLIPCYKDMDAYDLPEEFSHLQAQDMAKIGFINDVVRGIKKVTTVEAPKATAPKETVVTGSNANTEPLLKRAFMFLEDGEWDRADDFCEQVLNIDPECAQAYLGKLMAELKVKKQESLKDQDESFDGKNNYQKALRFGDDKLKATLSGYIAHINARNENARLEGIYARAHNTMRDANTENAYLEAARLFDTIPDYKNAANLAASCRTQAEEACYNSAVSAMNTAKSENAYKEAAKMLETISHYKDAASLAEQCLEKAEELRKNHIYDNAIVLMNKPNGIFDKFSTTNCEEAIKKFQTISGWKDADQQVEICKQKIEEIKANESADRDRMLKNARLQAEMRAKRIKICAALTSAVVCAVVAFVILLNNVIIPNSKYNDAIALRKDGEYAKAAMAFAELGDYKDSRKQAFKLWDKITNREFISAGDDHTVGLQADGTVVAVGGNSYGQCNVSKWKDIVAISAGGYHTIGLKADGTVVVTGWNEYGQCNVSDWKDIVAISAGGYHTIGLKADGTVVAVGNSNYGQCNVSDWKNIVAISAGALYTVGLKADGTVVAVGNSTYGQCNVSKWKDIVEISAASSHTVGLKADGMVVAVGSNESGKCDVSNWKDIVAISAGQSYTIGLKTDGTVVATGINYYGEPKVSKWKGIVAISAGTLHTVGLKADGTVVAVGENGYGQCNVSNWKNIKLPTKK